MEGSSHKLLPTQHLAHAACLPQDVQRKSNPKPGSGITLKRSALWLLGTHPSTWELGQGHLRSFLQSVMAKHYDTIFKPGPANLGPDFLHPSYQPGAQEQPWAAFQTYCDGDIYLQLRRSTVPGTDSTSCRVGN